MPYEKQFKQNNKVIYDTIWQLKQLTVNQNVTKCTVSSNESTMDSTLIYGNLNRQSA